MASPEDRASSIREKLYNTPILMFITQGRHVVSISEHLRGESRKIPRDSSFIVIGGRP